MRMGSVELPFIDFETIRLTRDGRWLANGEEITHEATVRGFARHLRKDADGYLIAIGRESKRIEVEDTAFFVLGLEGSPLKGWIVRLSNETSQPLDPGTLSYRAERLTCRVSAAGFDQPEEARFLPAPYMELLRHLEEDDRAYFLIIQGRRIELARKP